jgi:hypothetical protein
LEILRSTRSPNPSPASLSALSPQSNSYNRICAGRDLLRHEVGTTRFRLIGVGVIHLEETSGDDLADLLDRREAQAEHAIDKLRSNFGKAAVVKGWRWTRSNDLASRTQHVVMHCRPRTPLSLTGAPDQRRTTPLSLRAAMYPGHAEPHGHDFAVFKSSEVISPAMVKSV